MARRPLKCRRRRLCGSWAATVAALTAKPAPGELTPWRWDDFYSRHQRPRPSPTAHNSHLWHRFTRRAPTRRGKIELLKHRRQAGPYAGRLRSCQMVRGPWGTSAADSATADATPLSCGSSRLLLPVRPSPQAHGVDLGPGRDSNLGPLTLRTLKDADCEASIGLCGQAGLGGTMMTYRFNPPPGWPTPPPGWMPPPGWHPDPSWPPPPPGWQPLGT